MLLLLLGIPEACSLKSPCSNHGWMKTEFLEGELSVHIVRSSRLCLLSLWLEWKEPCRRRWVTEGEAQAFRFCSSHPASCLSAVCFLTPTAMWPHARSWYLSHWDSLYPFVNCTGVCTRTCTEAPPIIAHVWKLQISINTPRDKPYSCTGIQYGNVHLAHATLWMNLMNTRTLYCLVSPV